MRILKDHLDFKELVSRVLTFDYIGALVASLLFPLFLVPKLGLVRTSLLFGMLNAGVGLWATWLMRPLIPGSVSRAAGRAAIAIALLGIGLIKANSLTSLAEDELFADDIVYSKTTPYQRIVVTAARRAFSCSSTATCSSARPTSTGTTKPWCIRRWCLPARPAGAGARRRRRAGGAGGAAPSVGFIGHAGGSRSGHDRAVGKVSSAG